MLQGYEDIELFVQQVLVVSVLAIWFLQAFEHPPSAIALCLAKKVESFEGMGVKSENCSDLLLSSMMIPEYESMLLRLG